MILMSNDTTTRSLTLPSQAAAEVEATISKWHVAEGDSFEKGTVLAEAESAKSTFDFEAPCRGTVKKIHYSEGKTVGFDTPVIDIETDETDIKYEASQDAASEKPESDKSTCADTVDTQKAPSFTKSHTPQSMPVGILSIGTYLPQRVVPNKELLGNFSDLTAEYMYGVTGIKERRWADDDEKPSDMAYHAAKEALDNAGLNANEIEAIIVATTTPDVAMPATACKLQQMLEVYNIPCYDLSAACSGWLYGIVNAEGLIRTGIASNVLVVAVDLQSRMLSREDKDALFLFGDGAGATVVSSRSDAHMIKEKILSADSKGLRYARREFPGYYIPEKPEDEESWIRVDGRALFKFATESFAKVIHDVVELSDWDHDTIRWVVPHQANARILKAAARKANIPFNKFFLNIERIGNTSSASIPNALADVQKFLQPGDKIVLCSVGAGITYAAITLEW